MDAFPQLQSMPARERSTVPVRSSVRNFCAENIRTARPRPYIQDRAISVRTAAHAADSRLETTCCDASSIPVGDGGYSMKSKKLDTGTVLVFDTGDEVVSTLTQFARENRIEAAHFSAIGAFSDAEIGYFDWQKKDYIKNRVDEQVEVVSLIGDVALDGGRPKVHAHVVVGRKNGSAMGGHLLQAHVRPTLELVLDDSAGQLRRKFDPESGLALIDLEQK